MVSFHRSKDAHVTIAMMVVPESEIHQFGAGITDEDGRIIEWEEKPKVARTNLASMGIYVFDTQYLLKILLENKEEIDFGMHLIPKAIERDNVFAYPFHDYWRDVGTIQAYWEANMDLIKGDAGISPEKWGIRPNPYADGMAADRSPARFESGCSVSRSMISAGCIIRGEVENSVLSPGVIVEAGAKVRDSIIFADGIIGEGAIVDLAILDKKVTVGRSAVVGSGDDRDVANKLYPSHLYTGISLIGKEAVIPSRAVIGRNCIVQPGKNLDDFPGITVKTGETV